MIAVTRIFLRDVNIASTTALQSLNPTGREMVELEKITNKITDGTHRTPKYTESGIPFLRVTDLTESNDSKKFISEKEHEELIKRCNPEIGDILYTKNGTIGVAKLIDWDYKFSIFVSLALIKPKKEIILPKYLELLMKTEFVYNQAVSHSKSGTITNLHLIEIKHMAQKKKIKSYESIIYQEMNLYRMIKIVYTKTILRVKRMYYIQAQKIKKILSQI
jgi:hypothetical protein